MNIAAKKNAYDTMPYPVWKRIGRIEQTELIIGHMDPKGYTKADNVSEWTRMGAKIHRVSYLDKDIDDVFYTPYADALERIDGFPFGVSEKYVLEGETNFGSGHVIDLPDGFESENPLLLEYGVDEENPVLVEQTFIHAGKKSKATVIIRYTGDDITGYHNGLLKVIADDSAEINVIVLQTLGEQVSHAFNGVSLIGERATVSYTRFDFGGSTVVTDYSSHIIGDHANNKTITAYLGHHEQRMDIGFNSVHYGRYSNSIIETKGALMGKAKKIFRGNLKFIRGASKSSGREEEYVLLLDSTVHSDAIPALLCDEDDVSGEHAASAGQVDEQKLFYLMSRGFDEKEAKKLVIHGSFSPVIDLLPSQGLKEEVEQLIERSLADA